jgi:hypothetical protein
VCGDEKVMSKFLGSLVESLITRLYLTTEQMEQERIDEEEESTGFSSLPFP